MDKEEANKIIAEFMDVCNHYIGHHIYNCEECDRNITLQGGNSYSSNINLLVPVWKKLSRHIAPEFWFHDFDVECSLYEVDCDNNFEELGYGSANTPNEAAAIATAKAIQEITNG